MKLNHKKQRPPDAFLEFENASWRFRLGEPFGKAVITTIRAALAVVLAGLLLWAKTQGIDIQWGLLHHSIRALLLG